MTISYDDNFLNLLKRWKGSVWKAVWKEAAFFLLLYYSIRLLLMYCLTSEQQMSMSKVVKMFDSFTTKIPLQFLLGFYVGQVVTRWWAQVLAVPWPDEIMVWTNVFLNKDDAYTRWRKRIVARYLILSETLVLRNVSTRIRKRFPTSQALVKSGLMTEAELDCYHRVNIDNTRWQAPLQWIIHGIILPALKDDEISSSAAGTLVGKINDFRNSLRNIFVYDWVCIPLVYTQTCSVVVYGYFGFCLIGHQYIGTEADLYIPWLTILQFMFFIGWFKVAQDLMRPFGEDDDDIELNVLLDRHTAVAMNYADQLCSILPPLPQKPSDDKPPPSDDPSPMATDPSGPPNGDVIVLESPQSEKGKQVQDISHVPLITRLPYSRASLKSAKDHCPKMHSFVKIKNPQEEEIVRLVPVSKTSTTIAPKSSALEGQLFTSVHAIQKWKKLATSAPYEKGKQCRPNHF